MRIENAEQLKAAVGQASGLLQEIQYYAKRKKVSPPKVTFPSGYLRTAEQARQKLKFISSRDLKCNLSYTMMLADVQRWILTRTTLDSIAREMVIKLQLSLFGNMVESITIDYLRGQHGKGQSYKDRTAYMVVNEIILDSLREDLDWLWDMRNDIHLDGVRESEWNCGKYTDANYRRGIKAFGCLLDALGDPEQ